jgi:MarR family
MASSPTAPPASASAALVVAALEERDRSVLAELAREVDAWVTFQGLRRQLGVHQQALARTLRRLEADGLVAHDGKGYQLTDRGSAALQGHPLPRADAAPLPLLEALLPAHVGAGDVAAQLSRRGFGGLRWYAQSAGPGETALHWLTENGKGRVTVRVHGGSLRLEVQADPDDPTGGFSAARPVLQALAEIYGAAPAKPLDPLGFRSANGFPLT